MVDLVKIRKKKAKQKEEAAAAEQAQANANDSQTHDAAPVSTEPEPAAPVAATPELPDPIPGSAATPSQADVARAEPAAEKFPDADADDTAATSKLERFKSEAGRRREGGAGSIRGEAEQQQDGLLELLTFTIAGEHYAVDIERIVEIVTPRAITRIPNADSSIVGILSLRGTIVTLVDVRRKLRHASEPIETPDTRIVVIDFRNEIVGFVVDRVLRVVKSEAGVIEPHPVVHATELDAAIQGVFRSGGALTILLDLDKLLDHNTSAGVSA